MPRILIIYLLYIRNIGAKATKNMIIMSCVLFEYIIYFIKTLKYTVGYNITICNLIKYFCILCKSIQLPPHQHIDIKIKNTESVSRICAPMCRANLHLTINIIE